MKLAFVNVATGSYQDIALGLQNSIMKYVPDCASFSFTNLQDIGSPSHKDDPYAFKIFAIEYVRNLGYEVIIWCDSPIRIVKPIDEWLAKIEDIGVYLQQDGWTIGQWANDTSLEWFGVARDEAITLPCIYACIIGFDFRKQIANDFLSQWRKAYEAGLFRGKWKNDEKTESQDERCLGHRHDQTCAELTANKLGIQLQPLVIGNYFKQWD
jgi:hypothetical protein